MQTVTAASNLGAFAEMVQDGEDGVLCRDEAEWLEKLQWLIDDEPARKAIAGRAYGRCSRECVTIFHATGICEWVERHWNLRCAFVLPAMEISGGIRVALLHAEMLVKAGAQVSLFTRRRSGIMRVISIFRCCRPSERNCRERWILR